MNKFITKILPLLALVVLLSNCKKKAFDDYYGRPASLQPPIYQVLQSKGNFTSLLACIDKANYKSVLSAAGSWTMFAPNDSAFKVFLASRSLTSVSQLDSGTCSQIVTYSLVFNAFTKALLSNYQSNSGYVANLAFKRRTANYGGFYNDTSYTGQIVKALASNRNSAFVLGDNNNKYIPYFTDNYFTNKQLSATDYNYFYPGSTYTGFNVVDAKVVNQDIFAENGYIHEIDKVILPLPNIDKYLASNPLYSEFKKLFDKYMVQFVLNSDATSRYRLLTGLNDNVYIKTFNGALGFSPNNENYLKLQDNDGQSDGWTMFVPTNTVLLSYINTVLLENYTSLDAMPIQIIIDFLNAHMWQTTVWPTKFATTNNVQNEPAKFDPATDIIEKKILSNGIFYGTSKVQQANVFSTIYGRAYLDPKYLLMTRLLDLNYRYTITIPTLKFTMIMMSDSALKAWGYDYIIGQLAWQYIAPGTTVSASSGIALANLQRILAMSIIPTPNGELDNLTGTGIVETLSGDYIKYNANKFISAGSQDSGLTNNSGYPINVKNTKLSSNGRVYYVDNILNFSLKNLGYSITKLGSPVASQFNYFYQYLLNSAIFTPATTDILGVSPGAFYTVFIPNNAAIQSAVNAGFLPRTGNGPTYVPNFNPAALNSRDSVTRFLQYHILGKGTVVPDGKKTGSFETLFKKINGDATTVTINSTPGTMTITDAYGRVSTLILASSNNLADRAVIHLINNYLQYNPN